MILQLRDVVHYEGEPYEPFLATGMHDPLFNPKDFGMEPQWPHEGCSRGFLAKFEINFDRLYLTDLGVHLFDNPKQWVRGPTLHHVQPSFIRKWGFKHPDAGNVFNDFNNYYAMRYPLNFSGLLLIGDRAPYEFNNSSVCGDAFVREYEEAVGPAWCYQYDTLLRLDFREGQLIQREDLSGLNKKYRDMVESEQRRQHRERLKNQSDQPKDNGDYDLDEEPPF